MGIRNDVFGLEQIYQLQIEGQWSTKGDVWNTPSPFMAPKGFDTGYFAGGQQPSNSPSFPSPVHYSTVDRRIDYSNDTATAAGKRTVNCTARSRLGGATGNACLWLLWWWY